MENKKLRYCISIASLVAVFFGGLFLGKFVFKEQLSVEPSYAETGEAVREKGKDIWNFINPLLDCAELKNISNKSILDLKEAVVSFVEKQKNEDKISSVSVYFRDLNNGPWFGLSEKETFYPASLLKVPLLLSILKYAEIEPQFFGKQFVWKGESKNNEYFKATSELQNNQTYTVAEALNYMVKYSDNNAVDFLIHLISPDSLAKSYVDLGISLPKDQSYEISVRNYASFFRILYNSTFLSKQYSEDALHMLSDTIFNQGLVSGVPSSIKVAHKFGERELVSSNQKQLHDCGIVYYPEQPYLLCVMTRGKNFDSMASVIAGISKVVYQSVSNGGAKK